MVSSALAFFSTFIAVALASPPMGNIATQADPSLCVVPAGNAVGNGTPVVLAPCTQGGSPWLYDNSAKRFIVLGSNQCLDVTDGVNSDGTLLQTWECTGGPNQQFDLTTSSAPISIPWIGKNKCLDVKDGVFAPGTRIQVWDCYGGTNQLFTFPTLVPSIKFTTTAHPNFCIDVNAGSTDSGTPLDIFTCNGTPAQSILPSTGGFVVIGNNAIELTNGDQTNGNKIQVATFNPNSPNQKWIYDAANQALRFTANPNKCIDVTDGQFVDGTFLQIWDCTFGPNQRFTAQAA